MIVKIKLIQGDEFVLEVPPDADILKLKDLIRVKCNIPTINQRLVFGGKTLQDSMSLKECRILDGSKIHLIEVNSSNKNLNSFWIELTQFLSVFFINDETQKIVEYMKNNLKQGVEQLSLDDIERIAKARLSSS